MAGAGLQRMRVTFASGGAIRWVGHLDLHRAWERAIRRAGLPLAYSQGFNPQPRLHFAAALPVGFAGEAELADVYLVEPVAPDDFLARLAPALPPGIRLLAARPVDPALPSLQSQMAAATYRVDVACDAPPALAARLEAFMARDAAPRQRRKGQEVVSYDLRPLVLEISGLEPGELGTMFTVVMAAAPGATGRPDELLAELGLGAAPRRISRTALHLAG